MSDIFGGQAADAEALAELYDLEHEVVVEDLPFWRELARRHPGPTIDLGCGSGRLFGALLEGGAGPLIGMDGSSALLARARERVAGDAVLRAAAADGRVRIRAGDVREPPITVEELAGGASLVVVAGVVPHLDGIEDMVAVLAALRPLVAPDGVVVLDDLGPAQLPHRNLPLSVDWSRDIGSDRIIRRSQLERWDETDGLRVAYATLTERRRADGTIRSLPASFRLWYPSMESIAQAAATAGLAVDISWGSYELDPYDPNESERRIAVIRPAGTSMPGRSRP